MTSSRSIARWRGGGVFSVELIDQRPGLIIFQASGDKAEVAFSNESGGHRWQRIPPTERNGRVQTSTVTVAVLPEPKIGQSPIAESDLEWSTTRSSGAGGQNVNKVETCVIVKHIPSGLTVRCQTERSQFRNKQLALSLLTARLQAQESATNDAERSLDRRQQLGQGQRGDKRRTIRVRDNQVKDHITGRTWRYSDYAAGLF